MDDRRFKWSNRKFPVCKVRLMALEINKKDVVKFIAKLFWNQKWRRRYKCELISSWILLFFQCIRFASNLVISNSARKTSVKHHWRLMCELFACIEILNRVNDQVNRSQCIMPYLMFDLKICSLLGMASYHRDGLRFQRGENLIFQIEFDFQKCFINISSTVCNVAQ